MQDIHSVKPVIETPIITQNLARLFWVFFALLILVLLILLAVYLWRRLLAKRIKDLEGLAIDDHKKEDYANTALRKLAEAKKYISKEEYKDFHLRASAVLKEYLSKIYQRHFEDMTSSEILNSDILPAELTTKLRELFSLADMVKYAGRAEKNNNAIRAYNLATKILEIKKH